MLLAALTLAPALALAAPSTQWDLGIELDGEPTDRVCLVTPVDPDELSSPWFSGVSLDELVSRGVLVRDDPQGPIVFDRESAQRSSWFDAPLRPEIEPVREAFELMRRTEADDGRCRTREPDGCEPTWELDPPPTTKDWPWVVMCTPGTEASETVSFLSVRAVDLDRGFTPFVFAFDAFGQGVQVRFDSTRPVRASSATGFRASVGVVGGHVHRTPARPSFGGRVRVPLQSRCRTQSVRLAEDPMRPAPRRTVLLTDEAEAAPDICAAERFEPPAGSCVLEPGDLRRGVFDLRVPMGRMPRRHQLEVRLDDPADTTGRSSSCSSSTWSDGAEPEVVELAPTQVRLRWRWPCYAETTGDLRCPEATVIGGRTCSAQQTLGADACEYRCDATRRDGQSVEWPVTVRLDHEGLGMQWSYEIDALDSEIEGTLDAASRRFVVRRGLRYHEDDTTIDEDERLERWPAWWTHRKGDEIASASIIHDGTHHSIGPLGGDSRVVGSLALPGTECREQVEVRYVSERSTSRRYDRQSVTITWPFIELPPPDRSAFPMLFAANAGLADGFNPTGQGHLLLFLAGDVAYRSFARRDRHEDRPAWLLGMRMHAILGSKQYYPLTPPGRETTRETVTTWRLVPTVHAEVRFDQRNEVGTYFGVGGSAGLGWTLPRRTDEARGRIPLGRAAPWIYVAPEVTFHYRMLRASAFLGVMGPDPTFELVPDPAGAPARVGDRPYGKEAWMIVPGFMVGVEI